MSIKISQLPNLTAAQLVTVSSASFPIVANLSTANITYRTTIGNVKTYVETGNLRISGSIFANLTSQFANVTVTGNLNVLGTTTTTSSQNLSTNSSIIDLHTFNSTEDPWTSDDGRDIGLRFFWYKGIAGASALVWENSTTYLTWYGSGVGNTNTGVVTGTLGTMQLGQMIISNATPATANATGALQVSGGISTGDNIWADGSITATGAISTDTTITSAGAGTVGSLRVNAAATVGSTLIVTAATTVNSLTVNTFSTVGTTLTVGSNATVNGLSVNASALIGTTLRAIGGLQNTPIGNATASTGQFTTLSATGNITGAALTANGTATIGSTLGVTGNINGSGITLSGSLRATGPGDFDGGLQSTPIGNATTSTGKFTTVETTSNITAAALTVNGSATFGSTASFTGTVVLNNILPTANASANIGSTSLQFNTLFAKATSAQYADLAEIYVADAVYEPGTVVCFGGEQEITITTITHDTRVAGVVSANPAYLMNSASPGIPVALQGRVMCRVIGNIQKGDRIVASDIPGVATVLDSALYLYQPGCIIGKALGTWSSDQVGEIEIVVGRF